MHWDKLSIAMCPFQTGNIQGDMYQGGVKREWDSLSRDHWINEKSPVESVLMAHKDNTSK